MKPVAVHPAAEAEANAAFEWYWARSHVAAQRFNAELQRAFMIMSHAPQRCSPFLRGTRRVHLTRFSFSVVFRESQDRIQILAIAHAKRRPGYWERRSL